MARSKMPSWLEPQLATLTHEQFSDPAWAFERKLDGDRICQRLRERLPSLAARPWRMVRRRGGSYNHIESLSPAVHDREVAVIVSNPCLVQPAAEHDGGLAGARAQAAAACTRSEELQLWTRRVVTEAQAVQQASADALRAWRSSPAGREVLQRSAYARLLARLESMPVIEQAKGIIMAQSRCTDGQAFELLRRASQRSNVPVRDLAAQIVAKTVQASPRPVKHLVG